MPNWAHSTGVRAQPSPVSRHFNRDSGKMRGMRTTWGGRVSVRCALCKATLSAARHIPAIRQLLRIN